MRIAGAPKARALAGEKERFGQSVAHGNTVFFFFLFVV